MNNASPVDEEISTLKAQIEQTRTSIVDALLEIEHITLQENPRIEADYAVKIGCWENELLKAQIEARRARRKFQLAQARANSAAAIDEAALDEQLDQELEEWNLQLQRQMEQYVEKLEKRASLQPMSPADAREVKRLHRILVKRLHPDLGGAADEDRQRFFLIVQAAYKQGDLDALRSIELVTRDYEESANGSETHDELAADLLFQEAQLKIANERLEFIKHQNPYSLKDKLASPQWVCERVAELKSEIASQEEARNAYDRRFAELKERE